jgi:hypothetical protein
LELAIATCYTIATMLSAFDIEWLTSQLLTRTLNSPPTKRGAAVFEGLCAKLYSFNLNLIHKNNLFIF